MNDLTKIWWNWMISKAAYSPKWQSITHLESHGCFQNGSFKRQVLQLPLDKAKLVKILINFSIVSLICDYFLVSKISHSESQNRVYNYHLAKPIWWKSYSNNPYFSGKTPFLFYGFSSENFRFSTVRKNYADAQSSCEANGGFLFEPKTLAINNAVYDKAVEFMGTIKWAWIGINDINTEGLWVYSSDSSSIPSNINQWYPGQPDNYGGNQDCGYLKASPDSNLHGKWLDFDCNSKFNFICEF